MSTEAKFLCFGSKMTTFDSQSFHFNVVYHFQVIQQLVDFHLQILVWTDVGPYRLIGHLLTSLCFYSYFYVDFDSLPGWKSQQMWTEHQLLLLRCLIFGVLVALIDLFLVQLHHCWECVLAHCREIGQNRNCLPLLYLQSLAIGVSESLSPLWAHQSSFADMSRSDFVSGLILVDVHLQQSSGNNEACLQKDLRS